MKGQRPNLQNLKRLSFVQELKCFNNDTSDFIRRWDHVIFPNPGYPPDEVWAKYAGAKIDHTPLNQEDWQYDLEKLDNMITDKTKLLIINTPQVLTGRLVENPEAIAEIVLKHPDFTCHNR